MAHEGLYDSETIRRLNAAYSLRHSPEYVARFASETEHNFGITLTDQQRGDMVFMTGLYRVRDAEERIEENQRRMQHE